VHGDEQKLVVRRRIRFELLQRQEFGDLQVAPVGELPVDLTEAWRSWSVGRD
jgi:hypothetical protein